MSSSHFTHVGKIPASEVYYHGNVSNWCVCFFNTVLCASDTCIVCNAAKEFTMPLGGPMQERLIAGYPSVFNSLSLIKFN